MPLVSTSTHTSTRTHTQAVEAHKESIKASINSENPQDKENYVQNDDIKHPKFEITIHRKFEQVEMCEIFYSKWVKYLYLIVLTIYSFLALWSSCTVAGSAWAINLPFNFSTIQKCNESDFQRTLLPPEPCLNSYFVSLSIFGVIVILLSLLDLKEQAIVQVVLGLLRFVTVGAIVIYSIVKISESGNKCLLEGLPNFNETPYPAYVTNATHSPLIEKFNFLGWISAIPVLTYAFIFHGGLPSMTHPIKQKKYLHWLLLAIFAATGVCYFSIGIFLPLWFRVEIQETCTLNWASEQPFNS